MFSIKDNQVTISNNIQQIIDTAFSKQSEKEKVIEMNLHQFVNSGLGRDKELYIIPVGSLRLENFPNLKEIEYDLWETKTNNTPVTLQIINCPNLRKMSLPNNLEHIYIDGKSIRECSKSIKIVNNIVHYDIVQQKQDASVNLSIIQLRGRYYRKS